jgi:HK97 family phage portal protein
MGAVTIIDPAGEQVGVGSAVEVGPGRGDLRTSSMPAAEWFAHGGGRWGAAQLIGGKTISHARIVAEQPFVAAAVDRLVQSAIRVPLKAYRRTGDDSRERLRPTDHPLARGIVDPWEGAGQPQLVQHLLGNLLVQGNALAGVDEGARSLSFDDLDWRTATPIKASARRVSGWTVREDGEERELSADRVVHVAWWSPLGPTGISPLRQLGTTVGIEDAAQRYQRAMFANGARPPSAITASEEFLGLDRDERGELVKGLRADLTSLYASPENGGRPALLPPGLDWKPIGHTAVEAELIRQREVSRDEINAVFQVPPPMVGDLRRATFSNIVAQREMFYTESLAPPLVLIEQALNAQLVRHLLREDDVFVEFDFAGVLRGDRLKEVQALREAIDASLMTPNEGRSVLNMPRSDAEGMDDFYFRANNLRAIDAPDPDAVEPEPEPAGD